MPDRIHKEYNLFNKLETLMKVLREECPWDKSQTLSSLRTYTLEEAHEVLEAIEQVEIHGNWRRLQDELGDLLLQVAFYARIADEHEAFNLADVVNGLIDKMIYRHPHVFGDARPADLAHQWESLKDAEHDDRQSLMDGIPPLPALSLAFKQQKRAARVGFDWSRADDVLEKIDEELAEFRLEVEQASGHDSLEDEFGDVLFTLVNLGRKLGLDAELALMRSNRKFKGRFMHMEQAASKASTSLDVCSMDELEAMWQQAKTADNEPF